VGDEGEGGKVLNAKKEGKGREGDEQKRSGR